MRYEGDWSPCVSADFVVCGMAVYPTLVCSGGDVVLEYVSVLPVDIHPLPGSCVFAGAYIPRNCGRCRVLNTIVDSSAVDAEDIDLVFPFACYNLIPDVKFPKQGHEKMVLTIAGFILPSDPDGFDPAYCFTVLEEVWPLPKALAQDKENAKGRREEAGLLFDRDTPGDGPHSGRQTSRKLN
ncbi:hypothetical protein HNY73_005461 [Argiope bruennichi]|uniref:Uncharacterized protein n=1 Tax=Argiope bruennichi TaxID=94029 RepID=A0A8T0FLJ4_ARGBR|nr:hypothetical protein HNY73_005461 [Argiope bruennichi]